MLCDGEAKTGATGLPRTGFIDPIETLEDTVRGVQRQSRPKSRTLNSTASMGSDDLAGADDES